MIQRIKAFLQRSHRFLNLLLHLFLVFLLILCFTQVSQAFLSLYRMH